ncbi:MAG: SNF2-related protein [Aureispira sp.]
MAIKNAILKKYINSNTTAQVRSKGKTVGLLEFFVSDDLDSVVAWVQGTRQYTVEFNGLQSGILHSSCSCPYDYGVVCKHEVAVANEIDKRWSQNQNGVTNKKKSATKYSKMGSYELPLTSLDDISNKEIKKHAVRSAFEDAFYWGIDIEDITIKDGVIQGTFVEDYYNRSPNTKTTITILENQISLKCSCASTNKSLCKHQIKLLVAIREEFPLGFLSKEKIDEIKAEKLKEYGFSLDHPQLEDYFEFGFSEKGIEVIPKQKGLLRLSSFNDFAVITNKVLNEELIIKAILPKSKEKNKNKKEVIAIGLVLNNYENAHIPLSLIPIKGKVNSKNELSTKIVEVDAVTYLSNKEDYTQEEQFIVEKILALNEDELFNTFGNHQEEIDKKIIDTLSKVIPKLGAVKVYLLENLHRISRNNIKLITLQLGAPKISFKLIEEDYFYLLESYLTLNGRKGKLSKRRLGKSHLLLEDKDNYFLIKSTYDVKTIDLFRNNPELRFNKADYDNYYEKLIKPLSERYTVEIKSKRKPKKQQPKEAFKKQLFLSKVEDYIIFKPAIGYLDKTILLASKQQFTYSNEGVDILISRDQSLEKSFLDYIKGLHPNFIHQENYFFLEEDAFVENGWFMVAFQNLKENAVEVFGYNNLNLKYNKHQPTMNINIHSGIDWFDVEMEVAFGKEIVSLKDLKKHIINRDKYIQLKDGTIGILPEEWLEKYLHLFRTGTIKKDKIGVSKYQFSVIDTLYEEFQNENNLFEEHLRIKDKIANFETIEKVRQPRGLNATLRTYQKEGLKWLNFLDDFKLGGCLADDMGLGKTLQIIAFIKHLQTKNKNKPPHLIIVPTSLIFNWNEEVQKFAPSLKVKTLVGAKREKSTADFGKYDIILSTYGTVMNDIEYLKTYTFQYAILDESQAIKNPTSKRFKAVRLLQAENRLVLTGTPIENNTFDLYAQMTFVNPGLLGGIQHFKKEYATAIDKNKDKQVAQELKKLIDPFLLRRTKEQVATELPPKVEQFLYCTMGKEQRKLYDAYKNKYKDYLLGKIDTDGLGKSKMYVLEGLTKLRQICDSPSLLNDEEEYTNESIKIEELIKHITERTNNHKILVFSQFTKMLGLIKNKLDTLGIKLEYLDGKTRNRQQKVENFQQDESIRVFLISLKAGGTGLNLTAADYVYIVDPWWNPAVEAQAIDRCYRIGQKKKVIAYKMICKNTIEEKIVVHQQNKKQVSDDLIQIEESFVKSLDKTSIQDLFS